jgi:hypothetical protein
LKRIQENFVKLEEIKQMKADELVGMLDLFDGKLTLGDLLNYDIPLLEMLKRSKLKLNKEMRK